MSVTVKISPADLGKFERGFALRTKTIIAAGLRNAEHDVVQRLRVASARIQDQGGFYDGWRYKAGFTSAEIWNAAPHAIYVERGRRPNSTMPPLNVIMSWALRHGLPRQAAWPIARAIARRGIDPRPVLEPALPTLTAIMLRHAEAALEGGLFKAIKGLF